MFRHCVLFRWKSDVSDEVMASIHQGLDQLAEIPEVVRLVHGPDVGIREGNWDHALVVDFNSQDDYKVYANDEGHLRFIAEVMVPNISDLTGVQFEVSEA